MEIRNSSAVLEQVAGHRPHTIYSDQDGPASSAKLSSINGLWSIRSARSIDDSGKLRLYAPTREFQTWMEILRNGQEAHGSAEKRLGKNYRSDVRTLAYKTKIEALNQRKTYFETWQNEVAVRLPGNKTAVMGKYGTPASKTTKNARISLEGKRSIKGLLREHGLESILNEFQFTSLTTLRTEGMFGIYD